MKVVVVATYTVPIINNSVTQSLYYDTYLL